MPNRKTNGPYSHYGTVIQRGTKRPCTACRPYGIAENGQGRRNSGIDKRHPLCFVSIPALSASNLRLSLDVGRRLSREQDRPGGRLSRGGRWQPHARARHTFGHASRRLAAAPAAQAFTEKTVPCNRLRRPKSGA